MGKKGKKKGGGGPKKHGGGGKKKKIAVVPAPAAGDAKKKSSGFGPAGVSGVGKRKLRRLGGVVAARGPRMVGDVEVKEWQRLPRQLLQQYCQKQKRPRPRYSRARCDKPGMFRSRVVLPDPKSKEKDVVLCPDEPRGSLKVADEYAALLALHRYTPKRPHQRMLPEPYASAWLSMGKVDAKVTTSARFSSVQERKMAQVAKRERANKREARADKAHAQLMAVHMSDGHRRLIENLLESARLSRASAAESGESVGGADVAVQGKDAKKLLKSLKKFGFSEADAQRGIDACFDASRDASENMQEALNWLCLHIPEHRLPRQLDASSATLSVSYLPGHLRSDPEKLKSAAERQRFVAGRLAKQGYPIHRCDAAAREAVADAMSNAVKRPVETAVVRAAAQLMAELGCPPAAAQPEWAASGDDDEVDERAEEKETLRAIFGKDFTTKRFAQGELWRVRMRWDAEKEGVKSAGEASKVRGLTDYAGTWVVYIDSTSKYPHTLPVMWFEHSGLAAQQRLLVTAGVIAEFKANQDGMAGSPFLYEMAEKIRNTAPRMLLGDPPAPKAWLRDVGLHSGRGGDGGDAAERKRRGARRRDDGKRRFRRDKRPRRDVTVDKKLIAEQKAFSSSGKHADMRSYRANLPAARACGRILDALSGRRRVIVVSGETGCGKSTQIPQFLLDQGIREGRGSVTNVVCTQPRRISAVGLARRVATERGEPVGRTVGYRIRLENKVSSATRLTYMTNGILLRQLSGGSDLAGVSHVVVDEVHERSVDVDVLLLVLKQLLKRHRTLRVILMSATVDADTFTRYFGDCDALHIPGRTFPVADYYLSEVLSVTGYRPPRYRMRKAKETESADLQRSLRALLPPDLGVSDRTVEDAALVDESPRHGTDLDMATELVFSIIEGRATPPLRMRRGVKAKKMAPGILVFLPGSFEITELCRLVANRASRDAKRYRVSVPGGTAERDRAAAAYRQGIKTLWVLPLHSALPIGDQERVFERSPPGVHKVVCSTNIAETSITVSDVGYVIDSGKMKEVRYDAERKMSTLVEAWVSQANATQRQGRAGRVNEGVCFRLFSRAKWERMASHQLPEIHRTGLEALVLQLKLVKLPAAAVDGTSPPTAVQILGLAIQPPPKPAILSAVKFLKKLGALERGSGEGLTPLGQHLARLPVGNVQVGKMVILSAVLGCVEPVVTIAAMMTGRSPFVSPPEKRDEANRARDAFMTGRSDHLTLHHVFREFSDVAQRRGQGATRRWCVENFLHYNTLKMVQPTVGQYLEALADAGFIRGVSPRALRSRGARALPSIYNRNAAAPRAVSAALCAGLYPNVLKVKAPVKMVKTAFGFEAQGNDAKDLKYYTKELGRVFLHPRSINFSQTKWDSVWLVYLQLVKTSKMYVQDTTQVSPYALLLFGDPPEVQVQQKTISVDHWIKFKAPGRIAVLMRALRAELSRLLEAKIESPEVDVSEAPVVEAILGLLLTNGY